MNVPWLNYRMTEISDYFGIWGNVSFLQKIFPKRNFYWPHALDSTIHSYGERCFRKNIQILLSRLWLICYIQWYGGGIQLPQKRLPDSGVFSIIQAGWCQEGHPVTKNHFKSVTKTCSNIPMDRQLPYGD